MTTTETLLFVAALIYLFYETVISPMVEESKNNRWRDGYMKNNINE